MIKSIILKNNIEECYKIRFKVFIEEQKFDEEIEIDEYDKIANHILVFKDDIPVATARFFEVKNSWKIGRVCILKEYRNLKLGNYLMTEIEKEIIKLDGQKMVLSSQWQTIGFYEKNGFVKVGEEYLEEGCRHQKMEKVLQ
ncbi:MAG: GNAT family N-acetyltransferase [bacterium]